MKVLLNSFNVIRYTLNLSHQPRMYDTENHMNSLLSSLNLNGHLLWFHPDAKVSLEKRIKPNHMKLLLGSFNRNGHVPEFDPETNVNNTTGQHTSIGPHELNRASFKDV